MVIAQKDRSAADAAISSTATELIETADVIQQMQRQPPAPESAEIIATLQAHNKMLTERLAEQLVLVQQQNQDMQ